MKRFLCLLFAASCTIAVPESESSTDEETHDQSSDLPTHNVDHRIGYGCDSYELYRVRGHIIRIPALCNTAPYIDKGDPPPDSINREEEFGYPEVDVVQQEMMR